MHSRQLSRRPQPNTPLCLYFIKTIWMGNKDESTLEFNEISAEKKQQYETEFITWFRTLSVADKRELEREFNELSAAEKQKYETDFNKAEKRKLKDKSLTSLKEYQKVSCCKRYPAQLTYMYPCTYILPDARSHCIPLCASLPLSAPNTLC